ncbi:GntR family transcriptional regulator [Amycolatopsis pithecellobii]|uniref:FCD domain-containing protein n=1 Tax=Amycolatopsis pithecellobii TaxID=664692 RepID=A0A6N7ZCY8_9PSEU|nr:GntR family transcriptional regulator [Amycolatopsis pithecellobii]MTD59556.1 FCD domain-containing protein [Amycolatopsis pithecellobii]
MSPGRLSANSKLSAVDVAVHEIRRLILSGTLPPGKPFVAQSLAERIGVSHVPVREALRKLEAQGLVSLSPSRSAIVNPLHAEDLQSIYRMRLWIEPRLAALSAPSRTAVELAMLEDQLEGMFRLPVTEESWHGHAEFHRLYVLPAARNWELRILQVLWDASERFTRLAFDPVEAPPAQLEHNRARHAQLLDAARTRDAGAVERELEAHLEENQAAALRTLESLFSRDAD